MHELKSNVRILLISDTSDQTKLALCFVGTAGQTPSALKDCVIQSKKLQKSWWSKANGPCGKAFFSCHTAPLKEVKTIKVKPITAKQSIQEGASSFCKISRTAHISLVFLHNTSHSY